MKSPSPVPDHGMSAQFSGRTLTIYENGLPTRAFVEVPLELITEMGRAIRQRSRGDAVHNFRLACFKNESSGFVLASDLAEVYQWWCRRERAPHSYQRLTEYLRTEGFTENRSRRVLGAQARTWEGLVLRPEVLTTLRGPVLSERGVRAAGERDSMGGGLS